MDVFIEGQRYVPACEVPEIKDDALRQLLYSLTEIQYFSECSHKHRAWAWNALNAISPELAKMSSNDPKSAYDYVRKDDEYFQDEEY